MLTRIPHSTYKIIKGQQPTAKYLRMQKTLGRFYLKNFFKILIGQQKTGRFLEIGSGSGFQTAQVVRNSPGIEIVAIEPSADMIATATKYLSQQGLGENVQFVQGAVESQPLIGSLGKFDLIYSTFSLHHWTDPACALQNLYNALKPGGTLLVYDFQRLWLTYYLPLSRGIRESIQASYTPAEIKLFLNWMNNLDYVIRSDFPYLYLLLTQQANAVHLECQAIRLLDELKDGQSGQIVSIAKNAQQAQEMTALGIVRSAFVQVIENHGHHVMFHVGDKRIVADRQVASQIAIQIR